MGLRPVLGEGEIFYVNDIKVTVKESRNVGRWAATAVLLVARDGGAGEVALYREQLPVYSSESHAYGV